MRLLLIGKAISEDAALIEGLSLRLNASVTGSAASPGIESHLLDEVRQATVTIVDLRNPEALDCIRYLRRELDEARILSFVGPLRPQDVLTAREAGTDWCVSRTRSTESIADSVESLLAGSEQFTPEEVDWLRVASLSRRQVQILQTLVEVGSIEAVVERTGLSYNTVRVHLTGVRQKLGVSSTLAAVTFALRHRVVSIDTVDDDLPIW